MREIESPLRATKTIPAFIARTQLGQVLERATKDNDRFLISKRGQVSAVIMSIEDYLVNIIKQPEVMTKLHEQAIKSGASKLTLEYFRVRSRKQNPRVFIFDILSAYFLLLMSNPKFPYDLKSSYSW